MKDWYWKVVAGLGLVVAAAYVFGVCRPLSPAPVGAQSGDLIAVTSGNQNANTLFVIDVSKKVLLVYDSSARGGLSGFSLFYGRHIEPDAVVASRARYGELRYSSKGYPGKTIHDNLRRLGGGR